MEIKDLKCCGNCMYFGDGCPSDKYYEFCDSWEWDEVTAFERENYE